MISRVGACALTSAFCLAVAGRLVAQTSAAPATTTSAPSEETIVLSPFEVSATEDSGYSAKSTLAGTRIRTELKDVGSSISVVTAKFLKDTNSTNAEQLLVYTPSTEVAGQGGNYLGQGDGKILTNAATGTATTARVRGLAQADNTRDFFLTDIPWDGYNVGRVDLQRGPNAILFGIGSPAGIVNASLNQASFKNSNRVENQLGSYGTIRGTADFNRVLLKNELAIRVSLLGDKTKYRQDPAYKNDQRIYAAVKWDPASLNTGSSHTSIRADFEAGRVKSNKPMETPPIDAITDWYKLYGATARANGFSSAFFADPANPAAYDPAAVATHGVYLGNVTGTTDPLIGAPGNRVYDGVVTAFNGSVQGFAFPAKVQNWPNSGASAAGNVLGSNSYRGIATYDSFASQANLVGSSIGAYKAKSLTDRSIFDYYTNLLAGPNQSQFNNFHALNVALSQTFLNEKVGYEVAYDKQTDRSGENSFISNDATSVSIDVMKTLMDGSANPNFLRPVVYAGGGSAGLSWNESVRQDTRVTAFGVLDFADISGRDSVLHKIFGHNDFTGLYNEQKHDIFSASGNQYYLADSFIPAAGAGSVGQASRDDIFAFYLGAPANGSSAQGLKLQGLQTKINPNTAQSINYFNNVTNAWQVIPMNIVNNNLVSDVNKTYRLARKTADKVTSTAAVWQGYWLDGSLIPMFGYRTDKDVFKDAGNPPAVAANAQGKGGLINPFDPSFQLPAVGSTTKLHSKTYSLVTHLPKEWRKNMPGNMDISLIYDKSENFNPDSSRRDVVGDPVANPAGTTKEYGFAVSMLDDKLTLKVMHYKTIVTNATLDSAGISNQYLIGAVEAWGQSAAYQFKNSLPLGGPLVGNASTLYGISTNGHQVTWHPDAATPTSGPIDPNTGKFAYSQASLDAIEAREQASVDAWYAQQVPANFQTAWALTGYATTAGNTNFGAAGLVVTGDTISSGTEFELIANPLPGLDISLNASKTFATRTNLEKSYVSWITTRYNQFLTTASGDMRLWGSTGDNVPDLGQTVGSSTFAGGGESARGKYSRETIAGFNLFQALEGAAVPELRPWRFNVTGNYAFQQNTLKGFNAGGSYRWQQANTTGFPVIGAGTTASPYKFDVNNPYKGKSESVFDFWFGYERKLTSKIKWRVQLNLRNAFADNKLKVVTVEPDGSPAAYRIPEPRTWMLTNSFEF